MKKLFFSARFWKICILFPATVFLVYAECTFIWMIVNYWNSDRLFALVGVYFFEVTGMLLAVCVRSCVRCFQKYPTEYIPLPDKKWRRLFIGTVLLFVIMVIATFYAKAQREIAYHTVVEYWDDLYEGYCCRYMCVFIARAPVTGFLIWLIWDKLNSWKLKRTEDSMS